MHVTRREAMKQETHVMTDVRKQGINVVKVVKQEMHVTNETKKQEMHLGKMGIAFA